MFYRDLEDPSVSARKAERLAQSRIRLEQKEHHLKIQEEKNRLRKEKLRQERIEKTIKTLKRLFIEYPLKAGKALIVITAKIVSVAGTLFFLLREAAQFNPSAYALYNQIITTVSNLVEEAKNRTLRENVGAVFDKILSMVKSAFKRRNTDSFDRKLLNKAIKDERSALVFYAMGTLPPKSFNDSVRRHNIPKTYRDKAIKIVSKKIRLHDKRYNDVVGTAIVATGLGAKILPLLLGLLKAGVIGGIAGAISAPLKENITQPMIKSLVDKIKEIIRTKDQDQTYTEALLKAFKLDFDNFLQILKKEKSWAYTQLSGQWQRLRGMIP